MRQAVRDAWGVEVSDVWGCTEGAYAYSCGAGEGMHLPDDLVIVEPVQANGEPVAHGEPADKILLTNLYNTTQPLIRYEVTDAMTILEQTCACGRAHRRIANLTGRLDDVLVYPDGTVVHPVGIEDALLRTPDVIEYQVIQTSRGATVYVRSDIDVETERLCAALSDVMTEAGLASPEVAVTQVDGVNRLWSGKVRSLVPLTH